MSNDTQQMDTVPADAIDDFGSMHARQTSFNTYRVLNLADDTPTAYEVDIDAMTCNCGDQTYNNTDSGDVCKHLAYALYSAPERRSSDQHTLKQISRVTAELSNVAREIGATAASSQQATRQPGQSTDANSDHSDASDDDTADSADDDDHDGDVTDDLDPTSDQQELIGELEAWFTKAAGMGGWDPTIVDVSWGRADGTEGIIVDRVPWHGDYYDDGEWIDRDGFDEEKEKMVDSVLTPRDEFQWYGEPDYDWFIAEDDITEVVD